MSVHRTTELVLGKRIPTWEPGEGWLADLDVPRAFFIRDKSMAILENTMGTDEGREKAMRMQMPPSCCMV